MRGDSRYARDPAAGGIVLWACRQLLLWGGLIAAAYGAVAYRAVLLPSNAPAPAFAAATAPRLPAAAPEVPVNTLIYRANKFGHVQIDADVDGAPVRFLLDTGASFVALTPHDAAAAGISRYQLNYSRRVSTANGVVRVAPVKLREIRLGQMALDDVDAVVVENLDTSLLGQSFLKRLQSYEMRDGVLTITW